MKFENVEVNSERWFDLTPLLNEEFRDIKGYEGLYQVSNYGRYKSFIKCNSHPNDLQMNVLAIYNSASEASRKTGISQSGISYCCRTKGKIKGYIFRYEL